MATPIFTGTIPDFKTNAVFLPAFSGTIPDQQIETSEELLLNVSSYFAAGDIVDSFSLQNAPSWMSIDNSGNIIGSTPIEELIQGITVTGSNLRGDAVSNEFSLETTNPALQVHEYWRMLITWHGNAGFVEATLTDLEFRSSVGGATECVGGTAIASGYLGVNIPANAFDGVEETIWQSASKQPGRWVGYQFTSAVAIREVMLQIHATAVHGWIEDFKFQYSDDGAAWRDAFYINDEYPWTTKEKRYYILSPSFSGNIDTFEAPIGIEYQYYAKKHFYPNGGNLTYSLSNAPAWLTIDPVTGIYSGTTPPDVTTYEGITVIASSVGGGAVSNVFSIDAVDNPSGRHIYWRVQVTSRNQVGYYGMWTKEIEMREVHGGADKCNGGTVEAPYYTGENVPERAFDNDYISTSWVTPSTTQQTETPWITYIFPAPERFVQFYMKYGYFAGYPYGLKFQYSDDNYVWTTLLEVSGLTWVQDEVKIFSLPFTLAQVHEEDAAPSLTGIVNHPVSILIGCQGKE